MRAGVSTGADVTATSEEAGVFPASFPLRKYHWTPLEMLSC